MKARWWAGSCARNRPHNPEQIQRAGSGLSAAPVLHAGRVGVRPNVVAATFDSLFPLPPTAVAFWAVPELPVSPTGADSPERHCSFASAGFHPSSAGGSLGSAALPSSPGSGAEDSLGVPEMCEFPLATAPVPRCVPQRTAAPPESRFFLAMAAGGRKAPVEAVRQLD